MQFVQQRLLQCYLQLLKLGTIQIPHHQGTGKSMMAYMTGLLILTLCSLPPRPGDSPGNPVG